MDLNYTLASELNSLGKALRESADAERPRPPFKDGYTIDLKAEIRELDSGFTSTQTVVENGAPVIVLETAHLDSHELAGRLMSCVASRMSGLLRDNGLSKRKAKYTLELKFDLAVVSCEKEAAPEASNPTKTDRDE